MSKKTWIMISCLVLSLALGLSGSLAYLTDTDSEVNTFTMGGVDIDLTEEFVQGAPLKPGQIIPKKPIITNTGKNDAWVWLAWAIPAELDVWNPNGIEGAAKNVIHWNFLGATCSDYLGNQTYLDKAIADKHLPEGTTLEQIQTNKTYWTLFTEPADSIQKTVDGILYNVYVLKYNKALAPQEATLPSIVQVYLDERVDIDEAGNLAFIENGVKTPIAWNINTNGTPKILVHAYAIQAEGFDSVEAAYDAYVGQWSDDVLLGKTVVTEPDVEDAGTNQTTENEIPSEGTQETVEQSNNIE